MQMRSERVSYRELRQRHIIPHLIVKIKTGFLKRPHRMGIITRPGAEISGARVVFENSDESQREIFGIFQIENNGSGFKAQKII